MVCVPDTNYELVKCSIFAVKANPTGGGGDINDQFIYRTYIFIYLINI